MSDRARRRHGRGPFDMPGIVMLVSRRGETHVDAIGMMAIDGSEPMRRDTICRIASMSKLITAAATMIPVEGCKLRLDEFRTRGAAWHDPRLVRGPRPLADPAMIAEFLEAPMLAK